ncbi:Esterase LipI [Pseudocercospora fuligena]|uniref:Esterase LipI n=1 Tax=Pseudocercospora fuligena TaxID=685502 RepID=A0A8H6RP08_9PEZI|nr:Esterase LipI [Pseudocercospora fuligena]
MSLAYDPEFAAALAPLAEMLAARPKFPAGDALSRREVGDKSLAAIFSQIPDVAGVTRTNHAVPTHDGHSITVAEFRKQGAPTTPGKAMYYIHGGGMILGKVDVFEKSIASRCDQSGIPIFAVGYRLAPEHPHPIPVTDCWSGLQWLSKNAAKLGVDPARIVVMGESAGGGLAAGLSLMARDQKLSPPILKQILIFPMLDDRTTKPLEALMPFATWSYDDNITGWGALLGEKAGSLNPQPGHEYAAPARAENLSGLPPTFIDCGQLDIFIHEDAKFASRLMEANVPTEFHVYPGQPHAFMAYAPNATYSKLAIQNMLKAIELA